MIKKNIYNYFNVFGNWKLMRIPLFIYFFLPKINESTILKEFNNYIHPKTLRVKPL